MESDDGVEKREKNDKQSVREIDGKSKRARPKGYGTCTGTVW